jgi:hypothetical protein
LEDVNIGVAAQVAAEVCGVKVGLDHGVGHFRSLSITRQRHWLTYHFIATRHEGLCQVF